MNAVTSAIAIEPYVADPSLVWRGNSIFPGHDRLGFRNKDVPIEAAVVALGDSQTYGSQVRRDQAWPRQLERLAHRRVYNMAFPGWGPPQSLLLLDAALERHPRLVVEALYAGNDVVDSFTFVYDRGKLDQLRSTDQGVRRALLEADRINPWDDGLADQNPIEDRGKRAEGPPRTPVDLFTVNSRLFGLGKNVQRTADRATKMAEDAAGPPDDDPERQHFDDGRIKTVLTPAYRQMALDLDDPRIAEGVRITIEALTLMRDRCAAADTRFAVLLIPTKELALKEAVDASGNWVPPEYTELVADEDALRQILGDQLADRGIPFVDMLPALRALVRDGRQPYSETEDGHLSPLGQQAVAELLQSTIDRQDLLAAAPAQYGPPS